MRSQDQPGLPLALMTLTLQLKLSSFTRQEAGHFDWRFIKYNYWKCYCRQILVKICSSCPTFYCWYIPFLLLSTFKQNYKKLGCNSQEEKIKGSLRVRVCVLHRAMFYIIFLMVWMAKTALHFWLLLMIVYFRLTTSLCPVNYLFIHASQSEWQGCSPLQ